MKVFNLVYQFSLLKKGMIHLLERPVIPAEAEPAPHLMRGIQVSSTGSLFSQGQVWIPVFTGMTTWVRQQKNLLKELKGLSFLRKQESRSCSLVLKNSKGISVLFLVIAMLLMVTIGYVFSYLIPMKQKAVEFPIYSTQAFFLAQSGVEYAIRYASDQGWRRARDGAGAANRIDLSRLNDAAANRRYFGDGGFTIYYQNTTGTYRSATDILTSTGAVNNSSERRVIRVSNFSSFLGLVFALTPPYPRPCRTVPIPPASPPNTNRRARFYIQNVRTTNVILNRFSARWAGGAGNLQRVYMDQGAGWVQKYTGNYGTGAPPPPPPIVNFNMGGGNQTILSNQVIPVLVFWNFNLAGDTNIIITFYTEAGDGYTFNLDAQGDGLPTC